MKLARLALFITCLFATAPARAESSSSAAWKPAPPAHWHKTGIVLMIGGGVCLAVGATFAGLAAQANSDTLAGMKYHPASDDSRTSYQIVDGTFFITGGVALIAGLVLLW
jgi:hypothetical protein